MRLKELNRRYSKMFQHISKILPWFFLSCPKAIPTLHVGMRLQVVKGKFHEKWTTISNCRFENVVFHFVIRHFILEIAKNENSAAITFYTMTIVTKAMASDSYTMYHLHLYNGHCQTIYGHFFLCNLQIKTNNGHCCFNNACNRHLPCSMIVIQWAL